MLAKIKGFRKYLEFGTPQMEKSYSQFQMENEKSLLIFYNLLILPFSIIMLIAGIVIEVPLKMTIARSISVFLLVLAFLIRNKSRLIQKILLLFVISQTLFAIMHNRESYFVIDPKLGGFLSGNVLGIVELTLLLSYKDRKFRSFGYLIFLGIKTYYLSEELLFTWTRGVMDFIVMSSFLGFYMYDDILYRKIFKTIYEAGDKLKKFQDLLTYDLPSSLVIVNFAFDKIIYSNKFFHETFKEDGDEAIFLQERGIKVFNNFLIDMNDYLEDSQSEKQISLSDYVKNHGDKIENSPNHVTSMLLTYKNEDNIKFHYEIKLRKVIWDGENCYAIVLNDISDKQVVIALKLANEQKDKLISTISHELRTPINGTLALIEMAIRQAQETSLIGYLENMRSLNKVFLHLINSILDLSHIRDGNLCVIKTSFSIDTFLEEVKSLFIFSCKEKGLDFIINIGPDIPRTLYTDNQRLMEILVHLLGNAVKFTFKGSVALMISTDNNNSDPKKLMFSIVDTGIGINETDKAGLFKMFGNMNQSKNENSQGVGLGLTIANELVRALNNDKHSKIHFQSECDQGSKFYFEVNILPTYKDDSFDLNMSIEEARIRTDETGTINQLYSSPKKNTLYDTSSRIRSEVLNTDDEIRISPRRLLASPESSRVQKRALIVDDNPFNLVAAAFILDQLGFESTKALNGKEGLEVLEQSKITQEKFSFVLTDIQMPILDGVEMSRAIRQKIDRGEMYDLPIVAVTAKSLTRKEINKFKENGIDYAFEKPLQLDKIRPVLNSLGILK